MKVLSLLVAAAVAAAPAMAQSASPPLPPQLSPDARVAIRRLLDSATAAGIPIAPLTDKAAEGVLKGAEERRIVTAVQTLLHQLIQARDILGGSSSGSISYSLLGATANALQAGVPVADLRRLANPGTTGAPDSRALVGALVTLVDLIAKHVPTAAASASIEDLLRKRATEDQFVALRSQVAQDILGGQTPEAALAARTRAYLRALDAPPPAQRALPRPPPPPGARPL